jgi:O-antigen/teichoic acid export membrane protein
VSDSFKSLLSGRVLARSALWNFTGLAAPLFIGLIAIPLLIEGMGKERFGLLAIIWMGVGYFSLFDMGLGRALTKLVADRLGGNNFEDLGPLIWTALSLIMSLGVLGTVIVFFISSPLIHHVFNVELDLQAEAITAFRLFALGLPMVVTTSALIGLMEAHQRFDIIASVRIPLGILTYAGPLATLQFTPSLVWATSSLLAARLIALTAYYIKGTGVCAELKHPHRPRVHLMGELFRFGGWLTVTNVIGPLMVYFDRLFIGAILTMTAVTYYVTPYEVISRLQIVPQAIIGVMFPAMATTITGDRSRLPSLFGNTVRILLLLMLPVTSGLFLLAPEALQLWLGSEFRINSTPIVYWLSLGWLLNVLARPAMAVLQSSGRPDLAAKTHIAELVPYAALLWFLTQSFGIAGTAAAWCIRVLIDTVILNELTRRQQPDLSGVVKRTYLSLMGILVGFAVAYCIDGFVLRVLLFGGVCIASMIWLWPSKKTDLW